MIHDSLKASLIYGSDSVGLGWALEYSQPSKSSLFEFIHVKTLFSISSSYISLDSSPYNNVGTLNRLAS